GRSASRSSHPVRAGLTGCAFSRARSSRSRPPTCTPRCPATSPSSRWSGTAVKAGDILARISVPEYEKQVKQDEADVARAQTKVEQVTAAVTTAEADQ